MRTKRLLAAALAASTLLLAVTVCAQVIRPYRPGSVWTVAFIRMSRVWDGFPQLHRHRLEAGAGRVEEDSSCRFYRAVKPLP